MRNEHENQNGIHRRVRNSLRRAITLIEVIFSIGVILIGMLGLLSILPLAGRRAQDSISLDFGSALSDAVMKEVLSRRFLANGQLLGMDNNPVMLNAQNQLPSSQSFVLDPMFASVYEEADRVSQGINANDDVTLATTAPVPTFDPGNGYSQSLFPYFKDTYNPYFDPSLASSTSWTVPQPRMMRVGIIANFGQRVFLNPDQALRLVETADDLNFERSDDQSKGAALTGLEAIASGLEYGKRVPNGDFTWFATINPLPDGVYASVSVVVMRQRERAFVAPTATAGANTPQENAIGERIAYVTFASGFSGGAGGIVHLVASDKISDRIGTNEWVMLSRTINNANTPVTTDDQIIHRWYRIVSAGKAEKVSLSDPATSTMISVWRHKLILDGPDWSFGFATPGNVDALVVPAGGTDPGDNNTYATIVDNVVSVTERVVLVTDL